MALKDIANELGVSVSTVSRVLSNKNKSAASPELRDKIWEVAREQGYLPNENARLLRNQPVKGDMPGTIYCLYACPPSETQDDPFFSKLLESIEIRALKENYIVKYVRTTSELSSADYDYAFSDTVDNYGIVLGRFDRSYWEMLNKRFKRIIYVGLNELDVPCDQVICNSYDMAISIVDHFYELGHRNIGYIGSSEGRYRGYLQAMKNHGLDCSSSHIVNNAILSMEGGYKGMQELLAKFPDVTAVLCSNDMVSIGALRACKEKEIMIPKDVSLIGINDVENIQYTNPMLSSMHVPLEEMGAMGVHLLLDRINNGHSSPVKIYFPYYLVRRESCHHLKKK